MTTSLPKPTDPYPDGIPFFTDRQLERAAREMAAVATWFDNASHELEQATGCYTDDERLTSLLATVNCISQAFLILARRKADHPRMPIDRRMMPDERERFAWLVKAGLDQGERTDLQEG